MSYEHLTKPLTIKNTIFNNRVVFPPIQTNYATEKGEVTDRLLNFYKNIANNDVGLTIVGSTGISPFSKILGNSFCLHDQNCIPQAQALFTAMSESGSIPAVQLNHGGRLMDLALAGETLVGPSAIPSPRSKNTPHALTIEEVEIIIGQFVQAAVNAKTAGAGMIEFHGGHSYLLNEFLSPAANKRTDKYGGSTEKRAQMVREILQQAREKLGEDFIIGLRMSVDEFLEDGLKPEESVEMIQLFIEDGLDIIHVSGGGMDSAGVMLQAAAKGDLVKLAGFVKKQVKIPVIAVGGILGLNQAETVLENGMADMVAMGRALIADPALVTKTLDGRVDEVVECTSCMQCFIPAPDGGLKCQVNEDI
jgi:2,4-dienoyl-CoA reductase-like NADH-dependent reductase (Old Yellow Enzyme family)